MSEHLFLGKYDIYWANFIGLIVLTAIEVAAVGLEFSETITLFILVGIAIPRFVMIAAIFMHLWGDKDSRILTLDAQPQRYLTSEKKALMVDSFIKWRVKDVAKYFTTTGGDEERAKRLLSQRVDTGLRNEFGTRTVKEVVSGERDQLMNSLTSMLDGIAQQELGVEVIDLRVKRIDLPLEVSESVYNRMRTERERLARELRAQGNEVAEKIRATADKDKTVILADAYREAQVIKGDGDAEATATYASAYTKDPEFYDFTRSLKAYQSTFETKGDILLIDPDSDFFKYLDNSKVD